MFLSNRDLHLIKISKLGTYEKFLKCNGWFELILKNVHNSITTHKKNKKWQYIDDKFIILSHCKIANLYLYLFELSPRMLNVCWFYISISSPNVAFLRGRRHIHLYIPKKCESWIGKHSFKIGNFQFCVLKMFVNSKVYKCMRVSWQCPFKVDPKTSLQWNRQHGRPQRVSITLELSWPLSWPSMK